MALVDEPAMQSNLGELTGALQLPRRKPAAAFRPPIGTPP
jgi:hypothetical protein